MDALSNFITRQEVRTRTKWSYGFIDRHLPRVKIGRKALIPLAALERVLAGETASDAVADRTLTGESRDV